MRNVEGNRGRSSPGRGEMRRLDELLEEEIVTQLALGLRDLTQSWGVINLYDKKEIVLWTQSLGMNEAYSLSVDNTDKGLFVALIKGSSLPTPSRLYGGEHFIDQLDPPENFPKRFVNSEASRPPIVGRVMIWEKDTSLEEARELIGQLYELARNRGLVDEETGAFLTVDETYFVPR